MSAPAHPPHRPPTGLRAVAALEALKGFIVLAVGFGSLSFLGRNAEHFAEHLVTRLHLNPASHYPQIFIRAMADVNNTRLWWIAGFSALYATIRFVEAYGLWKARRWAEWLAALSGAVYIPIELYEIAQRASALKIAALIINLLIVGYMVFLLAQKQRHPAKKLTPPRRSRDADRNMKLLVTNDDGINSPFLHELVFALKAAGHELYVVAPLTEQSWTGASKTRHRPVQSTKADQNFGVPTWTVDGTPSDCVNIAIAHLLPVKVDAVVSGINMGFNCTLGFIIASGTVSAALEGALHGLPAMAVSQDVDESTYYKLKDAALGPDESLLATLRNSAAHAARMAGELLPVTPPRSFIVHNLNFPFPCRPESEVKKTVPAHFFVPGLFSPPDAEGRHKLIWCEGEDVSPAEPLTDLKCISAGHISHTVLDYRKLGHG